MDEYQRDHNLDSKFPFCISFASFWVGLISMASIYQVFSVFFWVSVPGFPNNINLSMEILIEILFILDIILRLSLRKFTITDNQVYFMNLFYINDHDGIPTTRMIRDTMIIIGGMPIATSITIAKYFTFVDVDNSDLYSYLLFFKLFRFLDLIQTRDKIKKILNNLQFHYVILYKLFLAFIILLLTSHIAACVWLFVNKAEASPNSYYSLSKNKYNNLSDEYVLAMEWAVSTMTGTCFGDVVPMTSIEIFASVIIMVVGSTFYGQIFADFEAIIYVSRFEKLEKRFIKEKHGK